MTASAIDDVSKQGGFDHEYRTDVSTWVAQPSIAAAIIGLGGQAASAQTYGLATMQPGTLDHTAASAIAKMLKDKAGINMLVQPTAGESVLIPMVARNEIDLGMANMLEVVEGIETGKLQNDLRIIGSIYVLRIGFFARKDSGIDDHGGPQGQARAGRLFRDAHPRQEFAGDARDRGVDAERCEACHGA